MKGLQSRMSNLGQQISDMYKRAENNEELASASLLAKRRTSDSLRLGSSISSPGRDNQRPFSGASLSGTSERGGGGSISSTMPRYSTQTMVDHVERTVPRVGGVDGQIPLPKPTWTASTSSPGSQYAVRGTPSPPRASSTYLTSDYRNTSFNHRSASAAPAPYASDYRHQSASVATNSVGLGESMRSSYQPVKSTFESITRAPSAYHGASGFQDTPKAAAGVGLGSYGVGSANRGGGFDSRYGGGAGGGGRDSRSTIGTSSMRGGGGNIWHREGVNGDSFAGERREHDAGEQENIAPGTDIGHQT